MKEEMNLNFYLQRIKISQLEKPNSSFISRLQEQHLRTVTFENLDIHQGKKIVLDETRIYEKIVVNERGGFCYELNAFSAGFYVL
jgi:N-hydroxyarylamine O-acetyltransferase